MFSPEKISATRPYVQLLPLPYLRVDQ